MSTDKFQGKVLIIGCHGMLGQDLKQVFSDCNPVCWDKDELDITDREMVFEKLAEMKPDLVINSAAYNAVDDAEEDDSFELAKKINGEGPWNLADACAEIGATLVHYSSDYVFAGNDANGYDEEAVPDPQSRYAESKRMGELNVLNSKANVFLIRTCRLFGAPGVSTGSKNSFVDTMLELAKTRDELKVVNEEVAAPTYTPDLAAQTRLLIEGGYDPGIYHITNSGSCNWYEFAQEIFSQAKVSIKLLPVPASEFPRPAARPDYSVLINTKLPPLRSWQEAVAAHLAARSTN
ncbi:MAG: dTDP-4-dehydrorhamnose reductase [Candidatus Kerfeldbacteria bacterium CG15_BIG_FIL_POST_REV_8_21_14_020_45_12]|uniref:dTDP-4-dehydrorhamnose reductase n=1 Tax=Candidatus Kerfeldbacteria bacterium CG15_BIG_FIL_POST_REV_8_21_14_020_45_12 TaxID=2014247 RepID=A0A2M7H2A5_9BACT|nr:MAG: dTDP-4-dehydrorhamnose reductase [Candidatus Kerfeldbacteria bacterium CG15_BIG_FIL_POST_REV_8_21_14_020_45_12]PJA93767.1 MAG: dTDP-4-dehydrorhamnose reductase [Candidatus Kerfeldbacteria bacterium CG_4_9_14_3_um_filter_45_8]